jgi:Holliday junction resolvase RusA-like endonuclease
MTSFGFRVNGIPAPQGSKIPGVSSKTGKMFVREQSSKTLAPWRQDVKEAAVLARAGMDTMTGPLVLTVDFFMPRPPSVKPAKRPYPSVTPDLDKLIRGVGDALRQAGVYADDAQIVAIRAAKRYAGDSGEGPGAWITISEVPPGGKLL